MKSFDKVTKRFLFILDHIEQALTFASVGGDVQGTLSLLHAVHNSFAVGACHPFANLAYCDPIFYNNPHQTFYTLSFLFSVTSIATKKVVCTCNAFCSGDCAFEEQHHQEPAVTETIKKTIYRYALSSLAPPLSLFLFSSIIMIEHCFVYLTALYKRRSSRTLYVQLLGSSRFEPLPRSPQPCLNFGREYQQGIFNSRRYDAVHTFDETKKRNFYNTTQGSLRMVFSTLTAKTPVMQLEIWHFS